MLKIDPAKMNRYMRSIFPIPQLEAALGGEEITAGWINPDHSFTSLWLLSEITSRYCVSDRITVDWKLYDSNPFAFTLSLITEMKKIEEITNPSILVSAAISRPTLNIESLHSSIILNIYNSLPPNQFLCVDTLCPIDSSNYSLWRHSHVLSNLVGVCDPLFQAAFESFTTYKNEEEYEKMFNIVADMYISKSKGKKYFDLNSGKMVTNVIREKRANRSLEYNIVGDDKQRFLCVMRLIRDLISEDESSNSEPSPSQLSLLTISPVKNAKKETKRKREDNPPVRRPIPKAIRNELWKSNFNGVNGNCYVCSRPISFDKFEASHIIPYSKGGSNSSNNLKPCCQACNRSMGIRNMNDYIAEWHPDHPSI
jgi:5-methylcytosine-specific restriction endonuclease McrA